MPTEAGVNLFFQNPIAFMILSPKTTFQLFWSWLAYHDIVWLKFFSLVMLYLVDPVRVGESNPAVYMYTDLSYLNSLRNQGMSPCFRFEEIQITEMQIIKLLLYIIQDISALASGFWTCIKNTIDADFITLHIILLHTFHIGQWVISFQMVISSGIFYTKIIIIVCKVWIQGYSVTDTPRVFCSSGERQGQGITTSQFSVS